MNVSVKKIKINFGKKNYHKVNNDDCTKATEKIQI
jgi:hypothetical protein